MLLSLSLQNFKKHEDLRVDFKRGLNGIFGPNYKGKSTLLYGILYALGGATQVPGTRLARRGSDGRFTVELHFVVNDAEHKVVRTKSTANLYRFGQEWEVVATGTTGVNDEIEKLIGMSLKQWKELHFAKQKNAHSLLRYSATNLHQLMRRLVGAEELDQVQARLKRMAVKEEGVLQALQAPNFTEEQIQEELDRLAGEATALEKAAAEAKETVEELTQVEQGGSEKIKQTNAKLQQQLTAKGEAETMRLRLDSATRGRDQAVEENGKRLGEWQAAQDALEAIQEDPEAGEKIARFEQITNRVNLAAAAMPKARARLQTAQEDLEKAKVALEQATEAFEGLTAPSVDEVNNDQNKLADLRGEVAVVSQKISDLTSAIEGAECPTCKRPFEDHDPAELQRELAEATELKDKLVGQGNALRQKITDAQGQATKVGAARRTLELAETQVQQFESAVVREENHKLVAEQEYNEATGAMGNSGLDEEKVNELRNQAQTIATARQNAARAKAEWQRTNAAQDAAMVAWENIQKKGPFADPAEMDAEIQRLQGVLAKDQETMKELRETLSQARANELSATQQLGSINSLRKVWSERDERLKADGERRGVAEKRLARITHLQKHLKTNAETYMTTMWSSFMLQASRFADQCTGGDIQGLQRTEDGSFVFLEEGEEMQLEEASGAQEAIIGLAVQIALGQSAPCNLHTILLDEPTADMDPECSLATMVAMKTLGVQVVFVSHNQTDNSLCDHAITL